MKSMTDYSSLVIITCIYLILQLVEELRILCSYVLQLVGAGGDDIPFQSKIWRPLRLC